MVADFGQPDGAVYWFVVLSASHFVFVCEGQRLQTQKTPDMTTGNVDMPVHEDIG